MKKVLVVDDDQAILTLLEYNLTKEGYEVKTAIDGQEALDTALFISFDFILLDIMLPKLDGIEVTKKLRQEKVTTPIIMLTARDEETDKIIGLELGADDYITKPFSPREVIARLKAIGRRVTPANDRMQSGDSQKNEELYTFQDFSIDLTNYTVTVGDQKISLTPKEFELLAYFVKRPGRVLSRENLLNGVWGYDYVGQTRMVDMHVSHLREKIEKDPSHPTNIQTVRGFGYKFEGKLDES
ncbi:response regulator transcription factor [Ligilactobacillus pobuzihii]|uniref:Alkaline phosphatase synthesis two-component response regulator n=1 Tax=Ligilactobacillus pobuzihii TaxID=449659 RepID=A0A0R2L6J5_9LACO|nr:response regulator transcription factor [Ligilactobacillus pobuzihii]KRK10531.1 Alkaline phosphatase synthesis two-component response regulator [Ligilactobacillus pobuzihii E100301 = KCTC 13174]KRN97433.1 Alkaline phosphatase synthesis two-component response regulator [Ligilactobacillus pobuzihii]GEN48098.1 DNA-binding response regulator [Ligilactobacillus pobuzihii]